MKGDISIRQELRKYMPLLVLPVLFSFALFFLVHGFTRLHMNSEATQVLDTFYMQISVMTRETESVAAGLSTDFSMLQNIDGESRLPYSFEDAQSICRQIEIRKNNSLYIEHIYFIYAANDTIYSDGGSFTYSSLPSILSGIGIGEQAFLNIEKPHWDMSSVGFLKEPYYVVPLRDSEGKITGRLLLTVSLDTFVANIGSIDAAFACLYSDDVLIPSRALPHRYSRADLSSEDSVSRLLGTRVKCFYYEHGDYTYLVARTSREYYEPLMWMIFGFFIYVLLVVGVGFLYLWRVSKARYASLKAMVDALPQESRESSPAYQELVPAVQSALMNASDLRRRQREMNREHTIHNILHRSYEPSVLQQYAQEIGIPFADATYYLALFSVREMDSITLSARSSEDSRQLTWTIFKTVAAKFETDSIRIVCDNDAASFNALFSGDFQKDPAYVERTCESICRFIQDEYGVLLHASVSNPSVHFTEIPDLLSQAQKLDAFSLSVNSASPVISEGLLKGSNGSFITGNFFRQVVTLSSTLLAKKYDVVPSMVASVLDEHVTNNPDYDLAMERLHAIAGTLAEALLTIKGVHLDVHAYSQKLREVNSVSDLNAHVERIFGELDREASAAPVMFREVDEACAYIRENLADKNLNVTMISEAVGTIPQRLIPLFQKQLNMGIAEYVNYQRVELAIRLLTTTKLKVTQISDQVGYCNTDTFTRNFRKLMGATPTEYRQMIL